MKTAAFVTVLFLAVASVLARGATVRAADPAQQSAITVVAVGDSACDPTSSRFNNGHGDDVGCHMQATSDLAVSMHPDAVLALGDNQYEKASLNEFLDSYDPSWGRLKAITHPALGNHEYATSGAAGYFDYFGSSATAPPGGYYSFDLGGWHFIALNSICDQVGGCGPGSRQENWLVDDLAAHRNACTVAYWHYPRFSSGTNGNYRDMQTFWDDLYAYGAEIVLNGHDHGYERFAPQTAGQVADPDHGIREFVVGTGGRSHTKWLAIQPNSQVHDGATYGVLRLTLKGNSYDWQFVPDTQSGNGSFTDKGSGTCHGLKAGTESPSGPRAVALVNTFGPGNTLARFSVDFSSKAAGQGYVFFGTTCAGLVGTGTRDAGAGSVNHQIVVTGNDLAGTVGDVGIMPGTTYQYAVATLTRSGLELDTNGGKCYSVTIPRG